MDKGGGYRVSLAVLVAVNILNFYDRAVLGALTEPIRKEFHLSDAEMARIRELHEGYLPKCGEMCAKIAAKKRELDSVLGSGTNITAEAQAKLSEVAELRAQCQAQMLQHFATVSRAMPPEQGRRYLAEMQKLTLGSHEQTESRMSGSGDTGHEHQH